MCAREEGVEIPMLEPILRTEMGVIKGESEGERQKRLYCISFAKYILCQAAKSKGVINNDE